MGFWWLLGFFKLTTGYATTSRPLYHIYGLVVPYLWLWCFKYLCLYNNGVKIFGVEGVLSRRFAVLERGMVYTIHGNICITRVSAWVYFFEKSFRVPKVVLKIVPNNLHWKEKILLIRIALRLLRHYQYS